MLAHGNSSEAFLGGIVPNVSTWGCAENLVLVVLVCINNPTSHEIVESLLAWDEAWLVKPLLDTWKQLP